MGVEFNKDNVDKLLSMVATFVVGWILLAFLIWVFVEAVCILFIFVFPTFWMIIKWVFLTIWNVFISIFPTFAGVAIFAWGAYKLFSGQNEHKSTVIAGALFAGVAIYAWGAYKYTVRAPHSRSSNNRTKRPFTLHFHGSDSIQTRKATTGCIVRDKQGKLVVAAAHNIDDQYPDCHIAIAEAVALRNGLRLAKDHNIKLDRILGDNEEVINRVHGSHKRPPKVAAFTQIIQEIMDALSEQSLDPQSQVHRIGCGNNKVAHKLASVGARLWSGRSVTYTREEDLVAEIAELIGHDQVCLEIFN